MNQLDPAIRMETPQRLLSPGAMAGWSADLFALAVTLSRQPVAVTGGLCSARLTLTVENRDKLAPVAQIPLSIGTAQIRVLLDAEALDGLAARLEAPDADSVGAGTTLSLDAVEALVAALLAPVAEIMVGRADWVQLASGTAPLRLVADGTSLALAGDAAALQRLYETLHARTDRLVPGPLALAALPLDHRLAVDVERVVGHVALDETDRAALQVGGGVLPDHLWPNGLTLFGRRFVRQGNGWRCMTLATLDQGCLLRIAHDRRTLDDARLASPASAARTATQTLELVGFDGVLATGRLVTARWRGADRQVFQIDRLGD